MSAHDQDSPLAFWVLGPLEVRDGAGDIVGVSADKRRRLLAALLLHRNTWVDTDVLAEALWGEGELPASVSGNLKTYVHQLRRMLPPDGNNQRLESRRGSYFLTVRPGELDADVFLGLVEAGRAAMDRGEYAEAAESQTRALALWRGDPGEGSSTASAVALSRLRELRWTSRDGLADALIAAGRADEAAAQLRPLVTEDPLREATWQRLVIALRDAHRPADALAAYHEARRQLVDELGVEPGARLRELHRELLEQTGGEPDPATPAPVPQPAPPVRETPPDPPPHGTQAVRVLDGGSALRHTLSRRGTLLRVGAVVAVLALLVTGGIYVLSRNSGEQAAAQPGGNAAMTAMGTTQRRTIPTAGEPGLLFGIGPEATTSGQSALGSLPGIGMYTTWLTDPEKQLPLFESWKDQIVPSVYGSGKALHVVVHNWDDPGPVTTKYGPGCGNAYFISPKFVEDMGRMATALAGRADAPPLYVSMYHGVGHIGCEGDKGYNAGPTTTNYYRALKDTYMQALQIIHAKAPNGRVSMTWDGWQASDDSPEIGGGRSMIQFFSDAMIASDFQSFNGYETDANADDLPSIVKELGKYGPVMMAYYGWEDTPEATVAKDLETAFTPASVARMRQDGLFAWSFNDDGRPLEKDPKNLALAANAVKQFSLR